MLEEGHWYAEYTTKGAKIKIMIFSYIMSQINSCILYTFTYTVAIYYFKLNYISCQQQN
jgi:hypothetical protein